MFGSPFNILNPPKATPAEVWAVTATSSLSLQNTWCVNDLHVYPDAEGNEKVVKQLRKFADKWYGVTDLDSLRGAYAAEHFTAKLPEWVHDFTKWLDRGMMAKHAQREYPHIKDIRNPNFDVWVWSHQITMARVGYSAQFIDRDTAKMWVQQPAKEIQNAYSSWEELNDSLRAARDKWNSGVAARFDDKPLYKRKDSPFATVPWNTPLG